ncbi:MAG: response regulator transcription factor [Treponema sp.]|jgi:DNA-binding NarL/FixJ family response regulator|nr:response regulator transcription factor [Treponema sp.]
MIRIVIIDEQDVDRICIETTVSAQHDFEIIGLGKDGYDALKLVAGLKPDILILDICLPGIIPLLRSKSLATAIMLFTSLEDDAHICQAIGSKVSGYLLKNTDMDQLAASIRVVYEGGSVITPRITAKAFHILSELVRNNDPCKGSQSTSYQNGTWNTIPSSISKTELRIMTYIGQGRSNQEIADKLCLTTGTVRNYISSAMQKVGLENRTQIALYAVKMGIIHLGSMRCD